MKAEQLKDLYAKIEKYANQVFGADTSRYHRTFGLEDGYIIVHDKACWHYSDSTDDEVYIITPEDLELPIEEAKEKYQNKLEEERRQYLLRREQEKLKEQKRKEEEEFKQYQRLKEKFS